MLEHKTSAQSVAKKVRVAALLTDAYGGHGGISVYNKDFIEALCRAPEVEKVFGFPRVITGEVGPLPEKLAYVTEAAAGRARYLRELLKYWAQLKTCDIIYCAHLNLAPLAWVLSKFVRRPAVLALYGIEAWRPSKRVLANAAAARFDGYFSISDFTLKRFASWSRVDPAACSVIPNAIHLEQFGLGDATGKARDLLNLPDGKILLTFGRLVSQDRAKGFDEVLNVMPRLAKIVPSLHYVIAGDGPDRARLERRAEELGVADRVTFLGFVKEDRKADLYRACDVYVMPSRGEGFGFVFLEAMACGVPVIASSVDGSKEAVLHGTLGACVDPGDPRALEEAIVAALDMPREIPGGLSHFSFSRFSERVHAFAFKFIRS